MTYVRTYAQDVFFRRDESHMYACLSELVAHVGLRLTREVKSVDIERVSMVGAYARSGQYYGSGLQVYTLYYEADESLYHHDVRAPSRVALRAQLRKIFPNAKISR